MGFSNLDLIKDSTYILGADGRNEMVSRGLLALFN